MLEADPIQVAAGTCDCERDARSHHQVVRTAASDSNAVHSYTTRSLSSLSVMGRILRAVPASRLKPMVG